MGCSSSVLVSESIDRNPCSTQVHHEPPNLSQLTQQKKVDAIARAEALFAVTQGQKFHDNYIRTTLVSYGASSKVLTAVHRASGKRYAAKAIPKDRHNLEKQYQHVLHEVGVMKEVEDHPNAVQLFEVYNDVNQYYLVMEYCEGGELFDHISKSLMGLTERQAAQILRAIMQFLNHMHSKGIAHMDIKPENIMFDSEGAGGILKIIDFGASVYLQPHEHVRDAFGTVRYSSPEMANDVGIGQKTDVWSAGVVMYLMLCGSPPFIKSSDIDTLNYIKKAPRPKFSGNKWGLISPAAKDCIRSMLEPDAARRPTAADVLNFPWLRTHVHDYTLNPDIINHLRTFANQSRMRRMLLGLMAANLTGSEANKLLNRFYLMDADSSGTIELPELVQAAQKVLPDISEAEVAHVFSALDVDHTGTIDLREFFAGLIHTMDAGLQSALALKSFTALDTGSEGFVRQDVFVKALVTQARAAGVCGSQQEEELLAQELRAEFKSLDLNNDGVLSFEEYKQVLHSMNNSPLLLGRAEEVGLLGVTPHTVARIVTPEPVAAITDEEQPGVLPARTTGSPRRVVSSRILAAAVAASDAQHDPDSVSKLNGTASHQNLILLAMEVQGRAKSGVPQSTGVSRCPSGTRTSSRRNSVVGLPGSGLFLCTPALSPPQGMLSGMMSRSFNNGSAPAPTASDPMLSTCDLMSTHVSRDGGLMHANTDGVLGQSQGTGQGQLQGGQSGVPPRPLGRSVDGHEAINAVAMLLERQRRVSNSRQLLAGARRMSTDSGRLGLGGHTSSSVLVGSPPVGSSLPYSGGGAAGHTSRPSCPPELMTLGAAGGDDGARPASASAVQPVALSSPVPYPAGMGAIAAAAGGLKPPPPPPPPPNSTPNSTPPPPAVGVTPTTAEAGAAVQQEPGDVQPHTWDPQYEITPFELVQNNEEEWCIVQPTGAPIVIRPRDFEPCLSTVASSALLEAGLSFGHPVTPGGLNGESPRFVSDGSSSRPGTLQTITKTSIGSSGHESSNSLTRISNLARNSGSGRAGNQLNQPSTPVTSAV